MICTNCGQNLTGKGKIKTKVAKAEKEDKGERRNIEIGAAHFAGLFLVIIIACGVIATVSTTVAMGVLAVVGLWASVATIMMVVGAFKDGDALWGVLGLASVVAGVTGLAFAFYYCTVGSERSLWKMNFWAPWLAAIATLIGGGTNLEMSGSERNWAGRRTYNFEIVTPEEEAPLGEAVPYHPYPGEPAALAVEIARPEEDAKAVDVCLVMQACDAVEEQIARHDPFKAEARRLEHMRESATTIADFEERFQDKAVDELRGLFDSERTALVRLAGQVAHAEAKPVLASNAARGARIRIWCTRR